MADKWASVELTYATAKRQVLLELTVAAGQTVGQGQAQHDGADEERPKKPAFFPEIIEIELGADVKQAAKAEPALANGPAVRRLISARAVVYQIELAHLSMLAKWKPYSGETGSPSVEQLYTRIAKIGKFPVSKGRDRGAR